MKVYIADGFGYFDLEYYFDNIIPNVLVSYWALLRRKNNTLKFINHINDINRRKINENRS